MSKIDFIHKKPVYIFKQENFLNLDLYNNLKYSFKNFDHNKLKKVMMVSLVWIQK